MKKVMIIDEQTLFREGIKAILKQAGDYQVVASIENEEQAWNSLEGDYPDIILINLELSDMQAIRLIRQMKQRLPEVKIITLVEEMNEDMVISAVLAGTDGFFFKKHYSKGLLYTLQEVYDGETVLSGPVAKMLASYVRRLTMDHKEIFSTSLERNGYKFTSRELDVAYLLKQNYSNPEIAKELQLGEGTVKNYISEIYNRLNIRIRRQAIQFLQDLSE